MGCDLVVITHTKWVWVETGEGAQNQTMLQKEVLQARGTFQTQSAQLRMTLFTQWLDSTGQDMSEQRNICGVQYSLRIRLALTIICFSSAEWSQHLGTRFSIRGLRMGDVWPAKVGLKIYTGVCTHPTTTQDS